MRIVGFGAHPDDVEFFFLGFLLACQANGHEIGWVVATDGRIGFREGYGHLSEAELAELRREEAIAAGELAGVRPMFLDWPDGAMKDDAASGSRLAGVLQDLAPGLIVTHPANDYHADHRALSLALTRAAKGRVPILFAEPMRGIGFEPMCYADITAHFPLKRDAILCHASQCPGGMVQMVELTAAFRAMQCDLPPGSFAEAFRLGEGLALSDVEALLPEGLIRSPAARMS
jgi:N-acetylglucosamine malate deacetylase 1